MKNILVTGGAGFIGSHLVDRLLLDPKNMVLVIDNLNTGSLSNLPIQNKNLEFVMADILGDIGRYFEDVDTVFHLAALTRPQYSLEYPIEANKVNVEGTLKVLMHAKNNGVRRTVLASSSSCYGAPTNLPTPEDEVPTPMSPYGLQKYIGELYAELFTRIWGLEVNCVRPFNVYGVRQNAKGGYAPAVPNFINNILEGKQSYITGDGEQSRDFTFVEDVVDVFIKAAETKHFGHTFNAGGGKSMSINDLYRTIAEILDSDIEPYHVEPLLEPEKTLADTSKARELLGWKPSVSIEEGLIKTIKEWRR